MLYKDGTPRESASAHQAVKTSALGSRPGSGGVKVISDATIASHLRMLQHLLSNDPSATTDLALPEHLNRSKIDFSLDSLNEIERYLNLVHDNEREIVGQPLLSTIWTIGMYVGEIIRRAAPEKKYEWVAIGEDAVPAGDTTIKQVGIGAVRALRAGSGDMSMPSLAVLRIILRGSKARSIVSYARGAIGLLE